MSYLIIYTELKFVHFHNCVIINVIKIYLNYQSRIKYDKGSL